MRAIPCGSRREALNRNPGLNVALWPRTDIAECPLLRRSWSVSGPMSDIDERPLLTLRRPQRFVIAAVQLDAWPHSARRKSLL